MHIKPPVLVEVLGVGRGGCEQREFTRPWSGRSGVRARFRFPVVVYLSIARADARRRRRESCAVMMALARGRTLAE